MAIIIFPTTFQENSAYNLPRQNSIEDQDQITATLYKKIFF